MFFERPLKYQPTADGLVTVAGMIQEKLEEIPKVGDECLWRGYRIEVIDVSRRGQMKVAVSQDGTGKE